MNPALALFMIAGYLWIQSRKAEPLIFDETTRIRYQGLSYYIVLAALDNDVPSWIIKRIGLIESNFDVNAVGSAGEIGFMQITAPVVSDYNAAHGTNFTLIEAGDPWLNVNIAAWLIAGHLFYYEGDIEKSVKAYNTGRGGVNSSAAARYWNRFMEANAYFPEGA